MELGPVPDTTRCAEAPRESRLRGDREKLMDSSLASFESRRWVCQRSPFGFLDNYPNLDLFASRYFFLGRSGGRKCQRRFCHCQADCLRNFQQLLSGRASGRSFFRTGRRHSAGRGGGGRRGGGGNAEAADPGFPSSHAETFLYSFVITVCSFASALVTIYLKFYTNALATNCAFMY